MLARPPVRRFTLEEQDLMVGQERSQEVLAGLTDEAIKEGMWP